MRFGSLLAQAGCNSEVQAPQRFRRLGFMSVWLRWCLRTLVIFLAVTLSFLLFQGFGN